MNTAREQKVIKWIRAGYADAKFNRHGEPVGPGETSKWEDELLYGVFTVDGSDQQPFAIFKREDEAADYVAGLDDPERNVTYQVDPVVLTIEVRPSAVEIPT